MFEYLAPNSTMTLSEAIHELRATEEQKSDISVKLSTELVQALEHHDAVHVLFGCGTTIQDEIAAHIWMVFGTTARLSEMNRSVANREHRNIISGIGYLKLVGIWVSYLPRIVGILAKCSRLKKRLALEELAKLQERSLCDIRREYGILLEKSQTEQFYAS